LSIKHFHLHLLFCRPENWHMINHDEVPNWTPYICHKYYIFSIDINSWPSDIVNFA